MAVSALTSWRRPLRLWSDAPAILGRWPKGRESGELGAELAAGDEDEIGSRSSAPSRTTSW